MCVDFSCALEKFKHHTGSFDLAASSLSVKPAWSKKVGQIHHSVILDDSVLKCSWEKNLRLDPTQSLCHRKFFENLLLKRKDLRTKSNDFEIIAFRWQGFSQVFKKPTDSP